MSPSPIHYLLVGLLFGTTCMALGLALGVWISKRFTLPVDEPKQPPQPPPPFPEATDQILSAIRNLASWTSEFSEDFNRYQSTMNSLQLRAADEGSMQTKGEVKEILDQIVAANQHLQRRLEEAELKLESQTKQLANFFTEARTDALTGLLNRRAFDRSIDEHFNEWSTSETIFSLALLDIDHFKSINDTYGHPVGDVALQEFARHLRENVPDQGVVARYGGEEFAILLKMDLHSAAAAIEQLRTIIDEAHFEVEGQVLSVTMSGGVSQILPEDRIGKLVRRSDEALYSAKLAGRNRVFTHNGALCEVFGTRTAALVAPAPVIAPTTPAIESEPTDPLEEKILQQIDHLLKRPAES